MGYILDTVTSENKIETIGLVTIIKVVQQEATCLSIRLLIPSDNNKDRTSYIFIIYTSATSGQQENLPYSGKI